MRELSFQNITTDFINDPVFIEKNIEVAILRLDKIHPVISGNKWFKLQLYIEEAKRLQKKTIVTYGGAWSNHIIAAAAACKDNDFNSIGIIRGEKPAKISTTLFYAQGFGMILFYTSRDDFKNKKVPEAVTGEDLYVIPEGGYGMLGANGAATILNHCEKKYFSHFCCAVGTGTMMAGLIQSTSKDQQVTGISVMKNNNELEIKIKSLLQAEKQFRLFHEYHFGGYAKYTPELITFMNNFYKQTNIPLDFVYTGKLIFAVFDLVQQNFFPPKSKLLLIHSGGLQGNASLEKGTLIY
ncbi:MAG: 1-aminocyclopropane-1-carboxylate deaminase [Bacteroidetes bacterium]|nr:1-aminocyclopropane-1-carboxylate deaminase [Bacteroidota bacterium]MBS1932142.1 1-aminocyclopropane-1-carboxylate deaminase [Bacteroidota bacterium]